MTLADELERLGKLATNGPIYTDSLGYIPGASRTDLHTREASIAEFVPKNDAALIVALRNNLPAIIAALRAQEWQPIETAPRDVQLILGHSEQRWIRFGRFYPEFRKWYYSGTNERQQYSETEGGVPTHWRPLHTPPAYDKGEPKP